MRLRSLFALGGVLCVLWGSLISCNIGSNYVPKNTGGSKIAAPTLCSDFDTADTTPEWTWSGPTDAVNYRYKLDDDLWTETTGMSYTPASGLSTDVYLFSVQAQDADGNWSDSAVCRTGVKVWTSSVTADENDDLNVLAGFEEVEGDLLLGGTVTELSALDSLVVVHGNLEINCDVDETELNNLSDLRSVNGNLSILNTDCSNFNGLDQIQEISGSLVIDGNDSLSDVNGFNAITSVGGDLIIKNTTTTGYITGFLNLNTISGSLVIEGHGTLNFDNNPFVKLSTIGNNIEILSNSFLYCLTCFEDLDTISGDLIRIRDNVSLSQSDAAEFAEAVDTDDGSPSGVFAYDYPDDSANFEIENNNG